MEDIEIVIKISEEEYNQIKENKFGVFGGHIFQAIRNGRPLSKVRTNEERWIPLSEGYPIMGVDVLVCTSTGCIYTSFLDSRDEWCFSECGDVIIESVTAWMPIPEPYKESEDKK